MSKRIAAFLTISLLIAVGCEIPLGREKEQPHHLPAFPLLEREYTAMRNFLDANGLQNVAVESTVTAAEGHVLGINLGEAHLTEIILTKDLDSLHSTVFDLALEKNMIQKVSVRDTIRWRYMGIYLWENNLTILPADFGRLTSRINLHLNGNQIDSIAPEVMSSGISSLDIAGNRLCDVPDTIAQWLDTVSVDKNWRESQVCD